MDISGHGEHDRAITDGQDGMAYEVHPLDVSITHEMDRHMKPHAESPIGAGVTLNAVPSCTQSIFKV